MPTNATPTRIQKAFREALAEGVFPGAVLLVQCGAVRRWHEAFGVADTISGEVVRKETIFDLASLTKPLCTSLAIMHLIQSGRLDLEDRLGDVVAAFSETDKSDIRIRQLLSHQAGFPAWRPYFEILRQNPIENRGRVLAKLLAHEPLDFAPGTASRYSDLDFLALQMVVETVSGRRLDRFAAEKIYGPLGIGDLFFTDTAAPPPPRLFAATEKCPWRGRVLKGHVHDDNAYALGGVAGHAGLFGSAAGVADLLAALLSTYRHPLSAAVLDSDLIRLFFERQSPSDWALGFDTPAARHSSSGQYFSANSVGHLGFTGTSFWMDPDRETIVVLLTNRVHPSRANDRIKFFRPLIHDLIMEALRPG